jgi:hypothetical protein
MERLWVCLGAALLCVACGDSSPVPITSGPSGYAQSAEATPANVASSYINEMVDIMQNNSINRAHINWTNFRAQVVGRAQGAETIPDLYPAIALALRLLGDRHSHYRAASGDGGVGNPDAPPCVAAPVQVPVPPADIGYVRITAFGSTAPGADVAFADEIEGQIRARDSPELAGWIVDVRGNGGGNMWPMIAGVGSVLGEGVAGYFVAPFGAPPTHWGYEHGAAFLGDNEMVRTSAPYALIASAPRVAVLTDGAVASSGEAVAVAFRARPNTRSFGSPTCGLSTANQGFRLSDGGMLLLTVSVMADRTVTQYGDVLVPDEFVSGDSEVVQSAIAWLRRSAF